MKKIKPKKTKALAKRKKVYPKTHGETLVNQKMLFKVRDELKSDIQGLEYRLEARFNKVDGRFNEIDSRFSKIDARFNEIDSRFSKINTRFDKVDARFNTIEAKLSEMNSKIDRILLLYEEQNNRNKVVLDGLGNLFQRQERLEGFVIKDV